MKLKKYKSIFENSISLFVLKSIDLGLTIALVPFLIQKLGIHNYGIYVFAISVVLFFTNVLNYGFNLSAVREIAKNKEQSEVVNKIFNEVFSVKLLLFVGLLLCMLLMVLLIPSIKEYKTLYFFCSLLLLADLFSVRWFFYGIEKMKYITFISFFGNLIYVSLVFCFIKIESDFVMIPLYEAIGVGVITVVSFYFVVIKYRLTLTLLSISDVFLYLKTNFSSFVNLLLPSTNNLMIIFVVGLLGTPVQVSFIQIGVKFSAIFSTLVSILSNVIYPFLNRKTQMAHVFRVFLLITGACLSIFMYVLSAPIIEKWLDFDTFEESQNVVNIVQILSLTPFLMSVVSGFGVNGLLLVYKDILFAKITMFSTLIMLISTYIMLPSYPILGSAYAFLLGKVIYALFIALGFVSVKSKSNFNIL